MVVRVVTDISDHVHFKEWLLGLKKDPVREQREETALSLVSSLEKVKTLLEVRKQVKCKKPLQGKEKSHTKIRCGF